jgi:hypothetical protein
VAAQVAQQPAQAAPSHAAGLDRCENTLKAASFRALAVSAHGLAHLFELALRFVHR